MPSRTLLRMHAYKFVGASAVLVLLRGSEDEDANAVTKKSVCNVSYWHWYRCKTS